MSVVELDADADALIASFEQPARMLANLGSILFVTTLTFEVRVWNLRAAEVLELQLNDVVGRKLGDCPVEWEWPRIRSFIELADTDPIRLDDVPYKSMSGTTGILAFTVTKLRVPGCDPVGFVWFGADVTERRRQQLNEVKSQKLVALGRLAAELAHEMNTPLQYTTDNVQFLRRAILALRESAVMAAALNESASGQPGELSYLFAEAPEVIDQVLEGLEHLTRVARTLAALVPTHTSSADSKVLIRDILVDAVERVKRDGSAVIPITLNLDLLPCEGNFTCSPLVAEVFRCSLLAVIEAASAKLGGGVSKGASVAVEGLCKAHDALIDISARELNCNVAVPSFDSSSESLEQDNNDEIGYGLAVAKAVLEERLGGHLSVATRTGEILRVRLAVPA